MDLFDIDSDRMEMFLYNAVASISSDYIYVWDLETDVLSASPNMVSDLGLAGNRMTNCLKTGIKWIHPHDRARVRDLYGAFINSEEDTLDLEYQALTANGTYIWLSGRTKIKRNSAGKPLLIVGTLRNMEQYEGVDQVTGLLRHSYSRERFESTLEGRAGFHGELLILGIDGFKNINILNSHSFGDLVLRTTAQDILKMLPEQVKLYRYDGDQFLLSGNNVRREEMLQIYENIRRYASEPHRANGSAYHFTVSGGIIAYPEEAHSWAEMEKGACAALRQAKENGKNQCVEFTAGLLNELQLSHCLTQSIDNGYQGFRLVFQPICGTDTLEVLGAEALLRYQMPDGREIPPAEFIPLLESSRLILPVGVWVLEQAIRVCKVWTEQKPDFVMDVNVSFVQLRDSSFCDKVAALLRKYGLPVRNLALELTESYFITDDARVNASLECLNEMRIELSMDDFGTGYSSLGRLSEIGMDVVKIDRYFVKALHISQYNHDFVESVIRLCHNLGKAVCMEGVETKEEWETISLLNADMVQGFYISRPVEQEAFFQNYLTSAYDSRSLVSSIDKEKLQRELENSKELLFSMLNATPLCLMLWNRQFEIMACNEKAVQLFGAEGKTEVVEHFYRFSPRYQAAGRTSIEMVHEKLTEVFVTGRSEFRWMHCDKAGSSIPVEVVSVRIPYRGDFVVASYTRDLRGEIELTEKRWKFRMRLKALLDATPLCLNLWDKEFHNTMCNREAVELFELESEQEYLDHFNLLSPERQPDGSLSSERSKERIQEAMQMGRIQFNWMHKKLDGELIPAEITLVRIEGLEEDGSVMVAGYTRDLRDQIRAEKAERLMARRVRAMVDSSPLACVLWNMCQEALDCNQIAVEMLGARDKEEVLHDFDSFMPLYQPDGSISTEKRKKTMSEIQENRRYVFEWVYMNRSGEHIPCEVTLVKAVIGDDDEDIIIAYSRDLRELKRSLDLIERLRQQACYDALTGCLTRKYFIELLSDRLQNGMKEPPVVLGLLDLDGFKNVNDTYGHEAGDMTLKRVIKRVGELLPEDAVIGRFGGDEFLLLLYETEQGSVSKLLQGLVERISHMQLEYQGNLFATSVSIGAVFQTPDDFCPDDLIRRADDALYQAKRNGRNRSVLI
ncbi:hypothetical protein GCM10008910_01960 [Faecalicatena orotica]|uniref:Diguanylate cyclase (GGDEF)-like protein n=1 Tax=Faecalicatena orotica TaxID=1544 RepID=A0A2Y9BFZ1_9FIRM|nr:EAL domain-containing protein [Faecalicatena orotica]PWJ28671.1 diguanylate cyclase (GGDEF)-like protein [Faecalicatena orotica]SSA56493.1 diguanylate cyclase (GGDEF) domain-containing protein [Faecalicatena orotica]